MKNKVLFVDDEPHVLSALKRLTRKLDIDVFIAEGGAKGLEVLESNNIDLVVSDMRMPEMDGAAFLTIVKEKYPDTVRYLLTGYSEISATIRALNSGGIYRYIAKPWDDKELIEIINDGLRLKRLESEKQELVLLTTQQNEELKDLNQNLEEKVKSRTEEIEQTSKMLDVAYKELNKSYESFIKAFSGFLNQRDDLQKGETQLVADLAKRIAQEVKLSDAMINRVYYAGLLYQIGKLGLPAKIIGIRESLLSSADYARYLQYPIYGETAVSAIAGFEKVAKYIRNQLENYDGSGTPDNLKETKIPSGSRIVRIAKDYICLQTGLLTEEPLSSDEAYKLICSESDKKYDPVLVKCLDRLKHDFVVKNAYSDEIEIQSYAMQPGMLLMKDIRNSLGLLLISKGNVLSENTISRLIELEEKDQEAFRIFVSRVSVE